MSYLSWNCRGLGRPRAVRALKDLTRSHKPTILGLIETKIKVKDWVLLRVRLGFNCCFAVNSRGRAGGLALLWNNESEVLLKSYSDYHIDVEVGGDLPRRVTLFYGHPMVNLPYQSWGLLRKLKENEGQPWLVMGDFNEVLLSWEMKGRRERNKAQMRAFRDTFGL